MLMFLAMSRKNRSLGPVIACAAAFLLGSGGAQAEEGDEFSVPLVPQPSGAFYVEGTLGGDVATELLVDTGSSYVALSRKTFAELERRNVTTYLRSIHGATATGRSVRARVYEVSELALGEDCVLESVEVVVLPGSDRDILGLSALRRVQPFTFDLEPLALRFGSCRQPLDEAVAAVAPASSPVDE